MSDEWDFYFCQVDDQLASIFLNLGLAKHVPLPNQQDLVWLRLRMREPSEDGLSSDLEYPWLIQIENALSDAAFAADTTIEYVGRNTYCGFRDFYFYAGDGQTAETCFTAAMEPFSEYEFEIGTRVDPEWKAYCDFLYPTEREYQTIMNARVVASLRKQGDRNEIEREVSHRICFKTSEDRETYLKAVEQSQYAQVDQHDDGDAPHSFALTIRRSGSIDFPAINDAVLELFDLAEKCDARYEGWKTSIEKGNDY